MTEPKAFPPAKLVCGIIASKDRYFKRAEERLVGLYGPLDLSSPLFEFVFTDYYEKEMGQNLKRRFLSFVDLRAPEELSKIKIQTNALEQEIREEMKADRRVLNLDPGLLTASALIMATAKDFSHRIPLKDGIYAHLEFLFGKKDIRRLDWTYPDYETEGYQQFFLEVRQIYLSQVKNI